MVEVLLREINSRFSHYEENSIYAQSTLLDPRFKQFGFTNKRNFIKAVSDVKVLVGEMKNLSISMCSSPVPECPIPSKRKRSIWDDFDNKVDDILKNTDPTIDAKIEVDKYLEECLQPRSQDPAKWWYTKREAYPTLYEIFKKRLCIMPTSVPSERLFSKAGQIIVERRNRLSGNKVSQILFLSSNL